jgi:enoyl-CoA hydratase/carnithine racemase
MNIESRDLAGGVRVLTLDRPPANALDGALLDELHTACDAARDDDTVRAVVVTGSGRFFSGGLDLKALSSGESGSFAAFGRDDGVFALWTLPKPTVAMVNGHAIAGGAIIVLACDFRIAARGSFKIGLNEAAIGLPLPTGAHEITCLALANHQARQVVMAGELHAPETARELGMIDEVVDPDDLERRSVERARLLGSYPRAAYAHMKRQLQRNAVREVREETDEQRRAIFEIWTSPETVAKLQAQLKGISSSAS